MITCLKSADLLVHAMIAALLPYVKWTLEAKYGKVAQSSEVHKWFKLAAWIRSADAYWDPKEECIQNKSDEMLNVAMWMRTGYIGNWKPQKLFQQSRRKSRLMRNQLLTQFQWSKQPLSQ